MDNQFEHLESLSNEEILALLKVEQKKLEPVQPQETVRTPPAEEVQNYEQEPEPTAPVQTSPGPLANLGKPGEWDYATFQKKFIEDPRAGMEYLETAKYGMPVSNLVPILIQAVSVQNKKLNDLEAQRFLDTTPEYQANAVNKKAIAQVLETRGWAPTYQTYKDAYHIAVAEGKIKPSQVQEAPSQNQQTSRQFVPPRPANRAVPRDESTQDLGQIIEAAQKMPLDQLESFLRKNGGLNKH